MGGNLEGALWGLNYFVRRLRSSLPFPVCLQGACRGPSRLALQGACRAVPFRLALRESAGVPFPTSGSPRESAGVPFPSRSPGVCRVPFRLISRGAAGVSASALMFRVLGPAAAWSYISVRMVSWERINTLKHVFKAVLFSNLLDNPALPFVQQIFNHAPPLLLVELRRLEKPAYTYNFRKSI